MQNELRITLCMPGWVKGNRSSATFDTAQNQPVRYDDRMQFNKWLQQPYGLLIDINAAGYHGY